MVPSGWVLRSWKVQSSEEQLTLKSAAGPPTAGSVTVTVLTAASSAPASSVTVRVTLTSPSAAKVWLGLR